MDTPSSREVAPLVCLIGYRGTGKTTVAERLSRRLNWPCLDADVELERQAGKTIREIFERGGEVEFRKHLEFGRFDANGQAVSEKLVDERVYTE